MSVREGITYRTDLDRIIGMVDLPGSDPNAAADHLFAIMLRGITRKWKHVIGYLLVKGGLQQNELHDVISTALSSCYTIGKCLIS